MKAAFDESSVSSFSPQVANLSTVPTVVESRNPSVVSNASEDFLSVFKLAQVPPKAADSQSTTGRQWRTQVAKCKCKPASLCERNFHREYLCRGLWPQVDQLTQSRLQVELTKLRAENKGLTLTTAILSQRIQTLHSQRNNSRCAHCEMVQSTQERRKHAVTQEALNEALDLSRVLLDEVRRLGCI